MSMLRTLRAEGFDGDVGFVHYARSAGGGLLRRGTRRGCPAFAVLHGYTRSSAGDLDGHVSADHLAAAIADPDTVYVCGPPALVDAVRGIHPDAASESFVPPVFDLTAESSGGRVTFADSGVDVDDDGRPLLDQAEAAGLTPESGCRMGICHCCTRRKTRGAVRNLITGAVSGVDAEDVQICVSVPVGDVDIAL